MKATIAFAALLALICTSADAKDNLRKNQEPAPKKGQEAFDSQDHRNLLVNPAVCINICNEEPDTTPEGCAQVCSELTPAACIKSCNVNPEICAQVCSKLTSGGCIAECNESGGTPEECAAQCTPADP